MNEVWRARVTRSSKTNEASLVKICASGQNRTRVPVTALATRLPSVQPRLRREAPPSGPSPAKTPGAPRWKLMCWVAGERSTSTSRRADSALTTDEPTPCRPPVATYEPPPNLPPACSLVKTTSTPESPVFGSLSTGMPRPLSWTSAEPSGCRVTRIEVQKPAERLVHAVVDDLPQAVHQAPGVGGADVHAGTLAHRLEPLEDEEVLSVVGVVDDRLRQPGPCPQNLPGTDGSHRQATRSPDVGCDTGAAGPAWRGYSWVRSRCRTEHARNPTGRSDRGRSLEQWGHTGRTHPTGGHHRTTCATCEVTHRDLAGRRNARRNQPPCLGCCVKGDVEGTTPVPPDVMKFEGRKAPVTTAVAPSPLTANDRCDRCGAQAYLRVHLNSRR